jgi:hypothetical protein
VYVAGLKTRSGATSITQTATDTADSGPSR